MDAPRSRVHVGASAVPLYTLVDPTAEGQRLHEGGVSQAVVHAHLQLPRQHAYASLMLNLEGKTIPNGELTTGAWGEGYVDRRHPHTYLHEAIVGVSDSLAGVAWSLTGGRGFAPFGSDDPMSRPFAKYPVNHHLAQVLERTVAIAGARWRAVTVEGGVFNGDEPITPGSGFSTRRFADSWSARLTARPAARMELTASYAHVSSPEFYDPQGFHQWKAHASLRWTDRMSYALLEWARTREGEVDARGFTYSSVLGEVKHTARWTEIAARVELSDRPEESRRSPFRTQRPAIDFSLLGVTRFVTSTVHVSRPVRAGRVAVVPFVEGAWIHASPRMRPTAFDPASYYGHEQMTMLTAGARIGLGASHGRMGRYGVATDADGGHHYGNLSAGHE